MNKFTIFFCLVAVAAVAVNAAEEQAPSANEYDVYNSNGDNVEDAARPKRFLLLKKKLLLGKAIALKKGVVLGGAIGGGALLAKKFGGYAPSTTYHHYVEPAPVHYVSAPYYDHAHYAHFDDHHHFDHHYDHHFDHHYDHHDDYHHGGW